MSSGRRKKPKYRDYNASVGENDFFGTVYVGMIRSAAFQKMSLGARYFYILCRVQAKSTDGRACLHNHGKEFGLIYTENDFVFPASHLKKSGIDRSNASRYFKELEAAGFIEKKEKNKSLKKVNVYSFSSRWKNSS